MNIGHSEYLEAVYKSPKKYKDLVERIANNLLELKKKRKLSFQAIAFRGTSGAAMAFPLSIYLEVPLICVRKKSDKSHGQKVEGPCRSIRKYIIIDDFICSGQTIHAIIEGINEYCSWHDEKPAICTGIILYDDGGNGSKTCTYNGEKIPLFCMGK